MSNMMSMLEQEIIENIEETVSQLHTYNNQSPDEYDIQDVEVDLRIILRNLKEYWR